MDPDGKQHGKHEHHDRKREEEVLERQRAETSEQSDEDVARRDRSLKAGTHRRLHGFRSNLISDRESRCRHQDLGAGDGEVLDELPGHRDAPGRRGVNHVLQNGAGCESKRSQKHANADLPEARDLLSLGVGLNKRRENDDQDRIDGVDLGRVKRKVPGAEVEAPVHELGLILPAGAVLIEQGPEHGDEGEAAVQNPDRQNVELLAEANLWGRDIFFGREQPPVQAGKPITKQDDVGGEKAIVLLQLLPVREHGDAGDEEQSRQADGDPPALMQRKDDGGERAHEGGGAHAIDKAELPTGRRGNMGKLLSTEPEDERGDGQDDRSDDVHHRVAPVIADWSAKAAAEKGTGIHRHIEKGGGNANEAPVASAELVGKVWLSACLDRSRGNRDDCQRKSNTGKRHLDATGHEDTAAEKIHQTDVEHGPVLTEQPIGVYAAEHAGQVRPGDEHVVIFGRLPLCYFDSCFADDSGEDHGLQKRLQDRALEVVNDALTKFLAHDVAESGRPALASIIRCCAKIRGVSHGLTPYFRSVVLFG